MIGRCYEGGRKKVGYEKKRDNRSTGKNEGRGLETGKRERKNPEKPGERPSQRKSNGGLTWKEKTTNPYTKI